MSDGRAGRGETRGTYERREAEVGPVDGTGRRRSGGQAGCRATGGRSDRREIGDRGGVRSVVGRKASGPADRQLEVDPVAGTSRATRSPSLRTSGADRPGESGRRTGALDLEEGKTRRGERPKGRLTTEPAERFFVRIKASKSRGPGVGAGLGRKAPGSPTARGHSLPMREPGCTKGEAPERATNPGRGCGMEQAREAGGRSNPSRG
jgi:hypothetical protein